MAEQQDERGTLAENFALLWVDTGVGSTVVTGQDERGTRRTPPYVVSRLPHATAVTAAQTFP
ncbi:hypothetical protein [Streptomyces sp. NBC_01363]|uniref:hypothetical protein n=1 Tax=Streptomyces sp. NBC_01363 TaxID=2903840 RepID=UPI0022521DD5|nr:hypothetical protein [Streptomyces sp. NBC_01363]MCX4733627.1 hypothetical protein [Streptomyces sp. NBC_01363]